MINAFVGSARAAMIEATFVRFRQERFAADQTYRTFILDLSRGVDELRGRLDKKWRNQLACAERNGLTVVGGSGQEEYRQFCQMYYQMRARKAFGSTVDVKEFGRIQEDLPESHRMLILICKNKEEPVAGLVASALGDTAIYLLGATSDNGFIAKGSYLLQWEMIRWLKEHGFKWYDLGGIDPERNPGVYHFKSGLSGADCTHIRPVVATNGSLCSTIIMSSETAYRQLRGRLRK